MGRHCGDRRITAPVSELLPEQVSPELLHLQVKLAAQLPYRQAAALLDELLPETRFLPVPFKSWNPLESVSTI
jgi:hypothetical protein